jgi:hypothetical protein
LPPPSTNHIDFVKDIKPILDNTCLRCHGLERPKSGFRLTDRASALKGGANGIDIVPGKSAESPLVYYVARVIEDMEMPPEGKGEPLTTEQVAAVRAWIDQGANWDASQAATQSVVHASVSPAISYTFVDGNKAKFRELEGQPDGWNGGLESFGVSQSWPDGRSVNAEGHLFRDDYKVSLELRKVDLGLLGSVLNSPQVLQ